MTCRPKTHDARVSHAKSNALPKPSVPHQAIIKRPIDAFDAFDASSMPYRKPYRAPVVGRHRPGDTPKVLRKNRVK